MPKITIRIKLLRLKTIEIVQKLVDSGDFESQYSAFIHVLKTKVNCGFDGENYKKAYQNFRTFKSRLKNHCNTL